MGILEVKNLTLSLGDKKILDGVDIDFWQGHVHAIVGPNGAGKSTLANTIMGLSGYGHFGGELIYDGQSLKDVPVDERARRGITLAWQEPARFEGLRVDKFILAGAKDKTVKRARKALTTVGLDPDSYIRRKVDKTLSGGERKRIELASILAMEPKLVLMDEPDSGIDVEALNRIFDAIRVLKERGTTIIMITHSVTVLQQAEHAFLVCCGKVIDKGGIDHVGLYFQDKCGPCAHPNFPELNSGTE